MFVPDTMLSKYFDVCVDSQTHVVTHVPAGFGVFTIGLINFLSRNDGGSTALKAIMIGNIVFHTLGLFFDIYDYSIGVMSISGLTDWFGASFPSHLWLCLLFTKTAPTCSSIVKLSELLNECLFTAFLASILNQAIFFQSESCRKRNR